MSIIKDESQEERKRIHRFGWFGFVFFLIIGSIALWRGNERTAHIFGGLSAFFIVFTLISPTIMRYAYKGWMAVVGIIGWVNRQLLLSIVFFFLVTPTGLILRLLGRDFMNSRIDPAASTYWNTRKQTTIEKNSYEKRF